MSMPARFAALRIAAFSRADTRICIWQVFAAVRTAQSMHDWSLKCQYDRIDIMQTTSDDGDRTFATGSRINEGLGTWYA